MNGVDVGTLLAQARNGTDGALGRLTSVLYHELRRLARSQLAGNRRSATLDTTALVHEAYLKLAAGNELPLASRAQFFAVAAHAMRQVLVDHARTTRAKKRGGGIRPETLDEERVAIAAEAEELIALDLALRRLGELNPRLVEIVECRFFVGLTEEETAEALGLSRRTVQRDWIKARGWLSGELAEEPS